MFEYKGAKITARPLTIADDNEIDLLCFRLGDDTSMYNAQKWAEYIVASSVESGENPVPFVSSRDTQIEALASYAIWAKLPRSFIQAWKSEMQRAEAAPKV